MPNFNINYLTNHCLNNHKNFILNLFCILVFFHLNLIDVNTLLSINYFFQNSSRFNQFNKLILLNSNAKKTSNFNF